MKKIQIVARSYLKSDYQNALKLGLTPLQARLTASRVFENDSTTPTPLEALEKIIFPKLKHIQHPNQLKNSSKAAEYIADAIEANGKIVLATDYDTDGVTSAWVATTALVDFFGVSEDRIVHMIGKRKNGYGITDNMCDEILAIPEKIAIVISADQGSSDEPRIKRLAASGIKVCITDHHQMAAEGSPASAVCTVNPQQDGCDYDKTIAGCFVIFLVMGQVRNELIIRGILDKNSPSLKDLALNVALGTVADSVSLKSHNNRAIVKSGLVCINKLNNPAWQALHILNNNNEEPFNTEYLGFQVATRINAASRVSDVITAFKFLNSKQLYQAQSYLDQLDMDNLERRKQQQSMLEQAQTLAEELYNPNKYTLAIKLTGNAGIQGIIASRIGEQYGVPTIAMTDLENGTLAGSGRGIIDSVDLRLAFQWMSEEDHDLFISMGGHKGASGCMIPIEKYSVFSTLFETAIKNQLGDDSPIPTVHTDGELEDSQLNVNLMQELEQLEPYGREWPTATFSGNFVVQNIKEVGQTKTHLSFKLITAGGHTLSAIFFNAKQSKEEATPFSYGDKIICAYQPSLNHYLGRTSLQLRILTAQAR